MDISTLIAKWSIYTLLLVCSNQPYTDMAGVAHINANCVATVQADGQDLAVMIPFRLTVGQVTFIEIEPGTEPVVRYPHRAYIEIDTEQDYGFAPTNNNFDAGNNISPESIDRR